jgi:hypothetical protein
VYETENVGKQVREKVSSESIGRSHAEKIELSTRRAVKNGGINEGRNAG